MNSRDAVSPDVTDILRAPTSWHLDVESGLYTPRIYVMDTDTTLLSIPMFLGLPQPIKSGNDEQWRSEWQKKWHHQDAD